MLKWRKVLIRLTYYIFINVYALGICLCNLVKFYLINIIKANNRIEDCYCIKIYDTFVMPNKQIIIREFTYFFNY